MRKYFGILFLFVVLIFLNGCRENRVDEVNENEKEAEINYQRVRDIGGDYSGSLKGEMIKKAKEYIQDIGQYKNNKGRELKATKIYPETCAEVECYSVEVEFLLDAARDSREIDKARVKVILQGLEVVDSEYSQMPANILTPEECLEEGGRTVNIVGGDSCEKGEKNIGDVRGFISPNICCVPNPELTIEEALKIAKESGCGERGKFRLENNYNPSSRTWWIGLEPFEEKEGCNPACVVWEEDKRAEVNWRCTGLLN